MNVNGKTARCFRRVFGVLFALTFTLALPAEGLEERLVILANSRQPESVALARFYAEQRDVPAANIVALPLPVEESIT
ncbi:MAG: hypothetical protein QG602_2295, partial [Verrucomicrobiota bacterium]|nr:hypothetical protein [Verrucomicrobiota bacterium]